MIDPACLPLPADQLAIKNGLLILIIIAVVLALAVSALMTPLLRRRYRQKVSRLMGMNHLMPQAQVETKATNEPQPGLRPVFDASHLYTLAEQAEHRIRRATAVAFLTFIAMPLFMQWLPLSLKADVLRLMVLAAVMGLVSAHSNWPSRQLWRARTPALGAFTAAGLICLLAWPESPQQAQRASEIAVLAIGLGLGATYYLCFQRSLRGQVLPIFCLVLPFFLGVFALIILAQQHLGSCLKELTLDKGSLLKQIGLETLFMLPFGVLMLLGPWLGLRALARLSDWLDRGWLSELSLGSLYTLVIWAALLCSTQGLDLAQTALLLVTWVGATVLAYTLALGPQPHDGPAPQLLMLRVFSDDTRHHSLLDVVQGRWRLLGPVHQIGGPDMVAMNVDPHEAMKFLTNRLHELFLPTGIGLADLQARLATQPDKEGRFRINEVFCFNTAWQATVVQLMQLSDVILLDVRGFNAARGGTGFEINQLAGRGLLRRVLAVGNAQTVWLDVDELVRKAGQQPALLQRVREDELVGDELFRRLCECAAWTAEERPLADDAPGDRLRAW